MTKAVDLATVRSRWLHGSTPSDFSGAIDTIRDLVAEVTWLRSRNADLAVVIDQYRAEIVRLGGVLDDD